MPTKQNNSGFGYLPILIISAVIISGGLFGYSWYKNFNTTEKEGDDVLAVVTPQKPIFNPKDLPVRWRFDEPKSGKVGDRVYLYFTGKDVDKLKELIKKIETQDFIYLAAGTRPCIPNGSSLVSTTVKAKVNKFLDDFYAVSIELPNLEVQNPGCVTSSSKKYFFIPGYDSDFVKAPINQAIWKNPRPYSQIFSTKPKSTVSKSLGKENLSEPILPFVDVSKFIPSQKD